MCLLIIPIKVNFKTVLSFFHYLDHLFFKLQNSNSAYSLLIPHSALHTCMAYLSRWLYSGVFVLFLSYCTLVLKNMFSPTAELTNTWTASGYLDKDIKKGQQAGRSYRVGGGRGGVRRKVHKDPVRILTNLRSINNKVIETWPHSRYFADLLCSTETWLHISVAGTTWNQVFHAGESSQVCAGVVHICD